MREILFKAKRLSDGAWVEGFPYWGEYSGAFILQNKTYSRRNARTFEISMGDNVVPIEVDPSTVCQYTGLTDKNGKKIFDGDVVRRETDYYGKHKVYDEPVVWEDDIEKGFLGEPYTSGYCIHGGNWEVIGSIHDGEGGNHA